MLNTLAICCQAEQLEKILEPLGRRVRGFYGSKGGGSIPPDTAVAVCTIEKANILVRLTAHGSAFITTSWRAFSKPVFGDHFTSAFASSCG